MVAAQQRHEALGLRGGGEDAFALGDLDDLIVDRVHDQQGAIERGDLTRLVVGGQIVEEHSRNQKLAPTDGDHRGPVPSDALPRFGDEALDVARRSGCADDHDAAHRLRTPRRQQDRRAPEAVTDHGARSVPPANERGRRSHQVAEVVGDGLVGEVASLSPTPVKSNRNTT